MMTSWQRNTLKGGQYKNYHLLLAAVFSIGGLWIFLQQIPLTFLGVSEKSSDRIIVPIPENAIYERNMSSVSKSPWKEDAACSQYDTRLGVNLPLLFLVSFPRSGNSWIRYLVEGATGFFTGSYYHDPRLHELGYLGEMVSYKERKTLLIKEHMFTKMIHISVDIVDQHPVVLIIRNPFKCFLSYFSYRSSYKKGFFLKSDPESFNTPEFHKGIPDDLQSWEKTATDRLLNNKHLHVIIYEELKADPIKEMTNLLKFLRIPVDEGRMNCLAKHVQGHMNRGQPNFQPYTTSEIELVKGAIERVSSHLVARGYPPLTY